MRLLTRIPLLLLVAVPAGSPALSRERLAVPSALEAKVPSLELRSASMPEALHALRAAVRPEEVVFTLEVVPSEGEPERNLDLLVRDRSVRQVLDGLISRDPRYTYELVHSKIIHVFPGGSKENREDLLNVEVRNFSLTTAYDLLFKYPHYLIPELEAEFIRRSRAGGIAGSMMGELSPSIRVSLSAGTVRDVLNEAAKETTKIPGQPAAGWIYTFRLDAKAPLGGTPHWDVFR